jgi:DNA-binding beta-propeller fold protein YncE
MSNTVRRAALSIVALASVAGCSSQGADVDLVNRAYIVSRDSDEVHVIDLNRMEILGVAHTGGQKGHMGELNADFSRLFVDSEASNETEVVDTRTLTLATKLATPRHPTHITLTRDGSMFLAMAEADNAVMFIDARSEQIVATLPGFFLPHFARMSLDGRYAYVANLEASHITRIDLQARAIDKQIALDGTTVPTMAPDEGGFADVQIDQVTGLLYAAHRSTGRVLVYDTVNDTKLPELTVGSNPWIVYAEHPFAAVSRNHVVPSFGDQSASILSAKSVLATLPVADDESYGVNYSPLVPDQAFVMNRNKQEIAVVDTAAHQLIDRIDVGGTTETASTTADGRYIVAAVSSANAVVVIDAATHAVVKRFDNVGNYPWSVTIPRGQNYCH